MYFSFINRVGTSGVGSSEMAVMPPDVSLDYGKCKFNWVEVGRVGREKFKSHSSKIDLVKKNIRVNYKPRFNCLPYLWCLVNPAVVHHNNRIWGGIRLHLVEEPFNKIFEAGGGEGVDDDMAIQNAIKRYRR
jgi:hypothetical protein